SANFRCLTSVPSLCRSRIVFHTIQHRTCAPLRNTGRPSHRDSCERKLVYFLSNAVRTRPGPVLSVCDTGNIPNRHWRIRISHAFHGLPVGVESDRPRDYHGQQTGDDDPTRLRRTRTAAYFLSRSHLVDELCLADNNIASQ